MTRQVIFILALAIISNVILAAVLPRIDVREGNEATRIAASVASGKGFSSPFRQPTGPSAWIPPIYPYLLAGIFQVFGVFTLTSYWVSVGLNILVHALTCVVLYRAAGEVFSPRVGWYSAFSLASFPLLFYPLVLLHVLGGYMGSGLFISPTLFWYTHLSELAIILLIWLTLHPPHWIAYGIAWGVASLLNPTILAVAPAFVAWRLWRGESRRCIGFAFVAAALCIAPWLVRNYLVFHRLVFIRDNFGVELRAGNQPGKNGRWNPEVHPDQSAYELSRVLAMGEAEYARVAGEEALSTIRAHPEEFVRNTILRIGYWWVGNPMESRRLGKLRFLKYLPQFVFSVLALYGTGRSFCRRNGNALLIVAVLVFYPLVHYMTHTFSGFFYQYPIHPEMLALATSGIICEKAGEAASTPSPTLSAPTRSSKH